MQPTLTAEYLASQEINERFWSKVNKDGPIPKHVPELGKCWEWTAGKDGRGYGAFCVSHTRSFIAHRASWVMSNGIIPEKLWVLHKCDNPSCVRPEHLFIGTARDNNRDRALKGRSGWPLKGAKHHLNKYSTEQVHRIREMLAIGHRQSDIARELKVHPQTVWCIAHNKRWRFTP